MWGLNEITIINAGGELRYEKWHGLDLTQDVLSSTSFDAIETHVTENISLLLTVTPNLLKEIYLSKKN